MTRNATGRPAQTLFAWLLAALAVAAAPSTGLAASRTVGMDSSYAFKPATTNLAHVGDAVRWKNAASSHSRHDVYSSLPGYFHSPGGTGGLGAGEHYDRRFSAAGTFGFLCAFHVADGMKGSVIVPISVTLVSGGDRFRIVAGSAPLSGTWRHVIQVRKPGASAFQTISTTSATAIRFRPAAGGTFTFRAAVKNLDTGALSGWSPRVSRTR